MSIKNFVYDSDYAMDYVVWKYEGRFSVSGRYAEFDIPHSLPFIPLVFGVWSETADFAVANQFGTESYDSNILTQLYSTSNKVQLAVLQFNPSATIYVRILGLRNPDYDGDVESIQLRSDFRKNSDFNYPKIYSFAKSNTYGQINHGLGYVPQCKVWNTTKTGDYAGYVCQVENLTNEGALIDENKLTLIDGQTTGAPFYYIIYGDNGTW